MAKMTAQIPLGRLGKPQELGATICFSVRNGAGFITGLTSFRMPADGRDGGQMSMPQCGAIRQTPRTDDRSAPVRGGDVETRW